MMALKEKITRDGRTQAEAAACFGVTQRRVSVLMRGKINLFALVNMAVTAGPNLEMRVREAAYIKTPPDRFGGVHFQTVILTLPRP
jgi:hypothetical protein